MQNMRTHTEAEQAGRDCGFDLVLSYDIATASPVAGPWYAHLSPPLTWWFLEHFLATCSDLQT